MSDASCRYTTVAEAAAILEVSRQSIWGWTASRRLATRRGRTPGGRRCLLVSWKSVDRLLAQKPAEPTVTIKEAGRRLGLSRSIVERAISTGRLRANKFVGCWYVPVAAIEEFQAARTASAVPAGYCTTAEAGRRLGLSRSVVGRLVRAGRLEGVKDGSRNGWSQQGRWLVEIASVEREGRRRGRR